MQLLENKISSLELVKEINNYRKQYTEKNELAHKTLLDIIRDEFEDEIGRQELLPTPYTHQQNGQTYEMFELTHSQAKQILVRESKQVRKAVIAYIEKLESSVSRVQIKLPTTYLEALKELVVKEETIILLQEKNEKLQFRSDFVDVCFDTDGLFSMEETAKILKLPFGRNEMMKRLRDKKVLTESNTPMQKLVANGYFKVNEQIIENGNFKKLISITYATQKGIGYIHKLFAIKE